MSDAVSEVFVELAVFIRLLHKCHGGAACKGINSQPCPICNCLLSGFVIPRMSALKMHTDIRNDDHGICVACAGFLVYVDGAWMEATAAKLAEISDDVRISLMRARRALGQ